MVPKSADVVLLDVAEKVLIVALKEIRQARARVVVPVPVHDLNVANGVPKSQTDMCVDVLNSSGAPLHVSALLDALASRGIKASRDSIVSAISKKLAPRGPFVRTAKNTFGLAARDSPMES